MEGPIVQKIKSERIKDSEMADIVNEKRIVLVGCPGSGKTMLAIGLFKRDKRRGVAITVRDPAMRSKLSTFVADIESKKKFPQKTPLQNGQQAEETDRRPYQFDFVGWRGRKFTTVFEGLCWRTDVQSGVCEGIRQDYW